MPDELLCIDTNVMIWGILQNGKTEKERHMIQKASAFFKNSFEEGKLFAISIITFAEFMAGIPKDDRDLYTEIIYKNFILLPYNLNAALRSADIFYDHHSERKTSYRGERGIMCADIKILATILAAQKDYQKIKFITEDTKFRKLAANYIDTCGIPDPPPEQGDLFE